MLRIRDVVWIIAGNLARWIIHHVALVCTRLRVGWILARCWWLLTIPYRIFRKISRDGSVYFSKHADAEYAPSATLLDLLFLPYNLYLQSTHFLGESEHDRKALQFWFTVAWLAIPLTIWFLVWVSGYGQPDPIEP